MEMRKLAEFIFQLSESEPLPFSQFEYISYDLITARACLEVAWTREVASYGLHDKAKDGADQAPHELVPSAKAGVVES